MLRFFRKIRQNLLSSGQLGKYSKYALGEILLVVIGILIAVQINNWNIKIQNEDKEILYLTRLTTNLGSDVDLYELILTQNRILIDSLSDIQSDLSSFVNTIENPVKDLEFLQAGYKFTANKTVIDNLISSGQIELLRSNYLVEDIFVYYRRADHIASSSDATYSKQNDKTISQLILPYSPNSSTDASYISYLRNSIDLRIHFMEKQIERYSAQKQLAENLIDRINDEIGYIEDVY